MKGLSQRLMTTSLTIQIGNINLLPLSDNPAGAFLCRIMEFFIVFYSAFCRVVYVPQYPANTPTLHRHRMGAYVFKIGVTLS
jgi:hypothetical protein